MSLKRHVLAIDVSSTIDNKEMRHIIRHEDMKPVLRHVYNKTQVMFLCKSFLTRRHDLCLIVDMSQNWLQQSRLTKWKCLA